MAANIRNFNIGHYDSVWNPYEPSSEPDMAKVTVKHDLTPSGVCQEIEV
jgi:hypothetical protein